jgi:hypothetical protein
MDTRLKIRYSVEETRNNLYTFGDEWQTADGLEYRGSYHQYITTQETFTEPEWKPGISRALVPIQRISPLNAAYKQLASPQTAYQSPQPVKLEITAQNRADGFIMRYFMKKINETLIVELSKEQYTAYQNRQIDNNMYIAGTVKWQITGPIETQTTPYLKPGVTELNTKAIASLKQTMPSISVKLSNLTEYYTDTDFIVPKNIN